MCGRVLARGPNCHVIKKKGTNALFTSSMEKQQAFIITDNQQIAALRMKPEIKAQTGHLQ